MYICVSMFVYIKTYLQIHIHTHACIIIDIYVLASIPIRPQALEYKYTYCVLKSFALPNEIHSVLSVYFYKEPKNLAHADAYSYCVCCC